MRRGYKVIGIALLGGAALVAGGLLALTRGPSGPPAQPIAFNHRTHVEERARLDCLFCHTTANRSTRAGIPSAQGCLLCHMGILPDHPEIRKLRSYREQGRPVPWQQVYRLPAFVYFSHKRHVRAGIECQECHGDLTRMAAARLEVNHTMGSCLACHQQRGAPTDCLTCHK
ncbi:MAG: cytochrome c3 family protein [Terriglobia bacterium]